MKSYQPHGHLPRKGLTDAEIFVLLSRGAAETRDLLQEIECSLIETLKACLPAAAAEQALSSLQTIDRACQRLQDLAKIARSAGENAPLHSPQAAAHLRGLPLLLEIRRLFPCGCGEENCPCEEAQASANTLPPDPLF